MAQESHGNYFRGTSPRKKVSQRSNKSAYIETETQAPVASLGPNSVISKDSTDRHHENRATHCYICDKRIHDDQKTNNRLLSLWRQATPIQSDPTQKAARVDKGSGYQKCSQCASQNPKQSRAFTKLTSNKSKL